MKFQLLPQILPTLFVQGISCFKQDKTAIHIEFSSVIAVFTNSFCPISPRFVVCHAFPYARPTAYRRPGRRPAPAGARLPARKKEPRAARLLFLLSYSMISVTTPEPTVLPPSLMANLSPSSIAIGVIRSISIVMLSPGMHISTPSGSFRSPVTSVVLK